MFEISISILILIIIYLSTRHIKKRLSYMAELKCKNETCSVRRIFKDGYCFSCYNLYIQEEILVCLKQLLNMPTPILPVTKETKQPEIKQQQFIPTITENSSSVISNLNVKSQVSSENLTEIASKLKNLGG